MRKRSIVAGAALLVAGILAVSLAGCSALGSSSDDSTPSSVAVSDGTASSREEFLASQETPSTYERRLYEEAVADGYEGTFVEFLQEIGYTGQDATASVNSALTSVVGIECGFTETTMSGWRPTEATVYSAGAGVIYSLDKSEGDAYIVTNYHVVYNKDSVGSHVSDDIVVYLYGYNEVIEATYVGGAMDYDIAVLKVDNSDVLKESDATAITPADSDSITVGENVYAIGNPEGEGISASSGVVSVTAEYIDILSSDETRRLSLLEIRTDAAVNHGNSGGGLFNAQGELIGIVNARSEESGVEAFGYAIPSNLALAVAQNVIDNADAKGAYRASLGLTVQTKSSESLYDETTGKTYIEEKVVVREITSGSVAEKMGLDINDTILSAKITKSDGTTVQEKAITRMHMLTTMMFNVRAGDALSITVSRNNEQQTFVYTFTEANSASEFTLFA